jgi:hypothetical protein
MAAKPSSHIAVSQVAWNPTQAMDFTEWLHQGRRLGSIGRGVAWWIGDWVNFGNAKFGEKYTRAARITGYDVKSLMNMAYVASRFELARRRESLTWSHHAELAALQPEEQDDWLAFAEEKRLSVRRLRDELRIWRSRHERAEDPAAATAAVRVTPAPRQFDDAAAVCPHCGHHLAPVPLPRTDLVASR